MTDYLEHGNNVGKPTSSSIPFDMPLDYYEGRPADVAARERADKDKIEGHHILRAIKNFVRKAIFLPIGIVTGTVLVVTVLESSGVSVSKYVKNIYYDIKFNSERQRMDELTKKIQREQYEAKQREAEQKRLEEKRREGENNGTDTVNKKKNRKHSFNFPDGCDRPYRIMKAQNSGFALLQKHALRADGILFRQKNTG